MFVRRACLVAMVLTLAGCTGGRFSSPYASGYYASAPRQCVPFAHEASGIQLHGDAYTWWDQAPEEMRSPFPAPGAVLVLARTPRMTHGHLAVVKSLVGPREIDVTHSNWGSDRKTRCAIYEFARVQDVSEMNDWSSIRFWNIASGGFGKPYAAKGFILNAPAQAGLGAEDAYMVSQEETHDPENLP